MFQTQPPSHSTLHKRLKWSNITIALGLIGTAILTYGPVFERLFPRAQWIPLVVGAVGALYGASVHNDAAKGGG